MKQRPFAVFDIDGTLIRWQLYHAIADAFVKLRLIDNSFYQPVRDARMAWKNRRERESFKAYESKLVETYEAALGRVSAAEFEKAAQHVFDEYRDQVYTYSRQLITKLKKQGYILFAISGSQTEIVGRIADHYGFDAYVGTEYVQKNGVFTGEKKVHLGKKHEILAELIEKHNVSVKGSFGVGDSGSDITMLEVVENPIAFNPDKALFEFARSNHWKIVIERKNMVYKLGYHNGQYILA